MSIGVQQFAGYPNNGEAVIRDFFPNLATQSPDGPAIVSAMSAFLGFPTTGIEQAARDGKWFDRYQYSKAFQGRFDYLGEVFLGLLYDTMDFLLSPTDGLPITVSNSLKVVWDQTIFAEGMLNREPEEGTAEVMLSSSEKREGHLLRRSKAIEVEHGFIYTEMGAKHFVRQLEQVRKAAWNTFSQDVLMTMLAVRSTDVNWRMKDWYTDVIDEQQLYLYTNEFLLWQKESDGAARTCTLTNSMHDSRARVVPSMMILPWGMQNLLRGADNSDQLDYSKVGPIAEQRRGADAGKITTFKDKRVHFTKKYVGVKTGQLPIEPMCSNRIFGEFYQMPPLRPSHPFYHHTNPNLPKYTSAMRSIQIMNLRTDKWETITLQTAFDNLACFDDLGISTAKIGEGEGGRIKGVPATDRVVESPFQTDMGNGQIRNIQFFGEMEEDYLSLDAVKLMLTQIKEMQDSQCYQKLVANNDIQYQNPDNSGQRGKGGPHDQGVETDTTGAKVKTETQTPMTATFTGGKVHETFQNIGGAFKSVGNKIGAGLKRMGLWGRGLGASSMVTLARVTVANEQAEPASKRSRMEIPATSGLGDMEKQVMDKISTMDPTVAKFVPGVLKILDDSKKSAFIKRTLGLMQSGDASLKTEFIDPIKEHLASSGTGLPEEKKIQREQLIDKLSTAPLTTGTLVPEVPVISQETETFTGFFTPEQLRQCNSVEYLDLKTGMVVSRPQTFVWGSSTGAAARSLFNMREQSNSTMNQTGTLYGDLPEEERAKIRGTRITSTYIEKVLDASQKDQIFSMQKRYLDLEKNGFSVEDIDMLLMQPLTRSFMQLLIDCNIYFPWSILILRPWICFETCSVIIGTGGSALGAMYIKDPDVMEGNDVTSKMHQWHLTVWSKAMIHNKNLISVWDDKGFKSYKGGGTCDFVTFEQILIMEQEQWRIPKTDKRGSIFAKLCGYNENKSLPDVINCKTRRLKNPGNGNSPPDVVWAPDDLYDRYLKGSPGDNHPMQTWVEQQGNNLCFQATQKLYNPYKGDYSCVIFSRNNHLGPNMYSGMMHDLRSMSKLLEEQHYGDTSKYTAWQSL